MLIIGNIKYYVRRSTRKYNETPVLCNARERCFCVHNDARFVGHADYISTFLQVRFQ